MSNAGWRSEVDYMNLYRGSLVLLLVLWVVVSILNTLQMRQSTKDVTQSVDRLTETISVGLVEKLSVTPTDVQETFRESLVGLAVTVDKLITAYPVSAAESLQNIERRIAKLEKAEDVP